MLIYIALLVLMPYDVILICSYYSCLKTHEYVIIMLSSHHVTIYIRNTSILVLINSKNDKEMRSTKVKK